MPSCMHRAHAYSIVLYSIVLCRAGFYAFSSNQPPSWGSTALPGSCLPNFSSCRLKLQAPPWLWDTSASAMLCVLVFMIFPPSFWQTLVKCPFTNFFFWGGEGSPTKMNIQTRWYPYSDLSNLEDLVFQLGASPSPSGPLKPNETPPASGFRSRCRKSPARRPRKTWPSRNGLGKAIIWLRGTFGRGGLGGWGGPLKDGVCTCWVSLANCSNIAGSGGGGGRGARPKDVCCLFSKVSRGLQGNHHFWRDPRLCSS